MKKNKQWEPFSNMRVSCEPLFIRLDGVRFGNTVKQLEAQKPFDERIMRALVNTTMRLHLYGLVPRVAFIISDEITLGFSRAIPYGGRVEKILSVLAGYFSSSVKAILCETFCKDVPVAFDARVLLIPEADFFAYLVGRQKVNRNNCIISYCATILQQEEQRGGRKQNVLYRLDQKQMTDILLAKGIDINTLPAWQTNGVVCYRDQTSMVEIWDVPPFDSEKGKKLFEVIYKALFLPDAK